MSPTAKRRRNPQKKPRQKNTKRSHRGGQVTSSQSVPSMVGNLVPPTKTVGFLDRQVNFEQILGNAKNGIFNIFQNFSKPKQTGLLRGGKLGRTRKRNHKRK